MTTGTAAALRLEWWHMSPGKVTRRPSCAPTAGGEGLCGRWDQVTLWRGERGRPATRTSFLRVSYKAVQNSGYGRYLWGSALDQGPDQDAGAFDLTAVSFPVVSGAVLRGGLRRQADIDRRCPERPDVPDATRRAASSRGQPVCVTVDSSSIRLPPPPPSTP